MKTINLYLIYNTYQGILYFLLGTLVSYVFFKLSIRGARVIYDTSNDIIIDKETQGMPEGIDILYNNERILKLYRTQIYIWNIGYKAVRKEDLVKNDILRVQFNDEVQIYSAKIIKNSDQANNFTACAKNKNTLKLDFDYLQPKSGVKIEILHNHNNPSIALKGKIIDLKEGIKNSREIINGKLNSVIDTASILSVYGTTLVVGFIFLAISFYINRYFNSDTIMTIGVVGFGMLPAILSPILLKKYTKSKNHPSYLD